MIVDERLAILENEVKHTKEDLHQLFALIREHMKKEETDRKELITLIEQIKTRNDRQTYFISGIIFAVSLAWTVIKAL